MTAAPAKAAALIAAILVMLERQELEHVRELVALLELELVHRDTKPPNAVVERPAAHVPAAAPTSPVEASASKPRAMTAAERKRKQRANEKAARAAAAAADPRQLSLDVTAVTTCHAPAAPSVTESVTRDVTPSSDLLSALEPQGGSEAERESSRELPVTSRDSVTVTPLVLPEALPPELRSIFGVELARRKGVVIDPDWLWGKLRKKNEETKEEKKKILSLGELRMKWRYWCRNEWPPKTPLPAKPPPAAEATGPGPRDTSPDPAEIARLRDEEARELRDRHARERAEEREKWKASWGGRKWEPFTPAALEAAVKARAS